jgi:hypothetical protein
MALSPHGTSWSHVPSHIPNVQAITVATSMCNDISNLSTMLLETGGTAICIDARRRLFTIRKNDILIAGGYFAFLRILTIF